MSKTSKFMIQAIIVFTFVLLSYGVAIGAQVTKVQGKKVMLDLDDDSTAPGTKVYATNSAGKKIGLIEIQKVKGKKALGQIVKGKAIVGSVIIPTGASGSTSAAAEDESEDEAPTKGGTKSYWGVLAGMSMNSMKVKFTNPSGSATMSGSSFNLLGFFEYPFYPQIAIRFWSGMETFAAKGSATTTNCENSDDCNLSVSYLALGGVLKYEFFTKPVRYWVGGQYTYLIPMSKSSTAIADSQIANNYSYGLSTGFDYPMSGGSFIPVQLEYSFFSNSETVTATQTIIRAGYGMNW